MTAMFITRLLAPIVAVFITVAPSLALQVQEVTSPGGIRAWLVEDHQIPFTALELRFRGGASLDDPAKRGAINLMTATLEEGSGDYDSQGFAAAQQSLAASFGFDVDNDELSVSARMLSENRDKAVSLLQDALNDPHFDQASVDRVRGQVLSILASRAQDPGSIASAALRKQAFGDHPYATDLNGTADGVKALTREDMFDAKARVMSRDHVVAAAVGDITAPELGAMLDKLLGDLPATGAPMPAQAPVNLTAGTTVINFDGPQSVILFAQQGLPMDDPDYFAAMVLNQILGAGGFSSRLMDEVREKRGLTYGISTALSPMEHAALWQGGLAASNQNVAQAIGVIKDEWAKAATGAVTDQELTDAKTYLTGAYPLRFDGNGQIATILAAMQMSGLPVDYIDTRNTMVDAVTKDDVARVAKRVIAPDGPKFIVVGKPDAMN